MDLSVVIPVYNEEMNIAPLAAEIESALVGRVDYEIVYVDDGSDDATLAELESAAERHPSLRFIRLPGRCGKTRALIEGVRAARASTIVTLDGDCQNDPHDIPRLWQRMTEEGAPDPALLICGHRTARHDTRWKRFASRIGNGVRRGVLGDPVPDSGCGFKMFSRDAFLELPRFDHMHRFLPPLFIRQGATVVSMPVNHRDRLGGESKYGVFDRMWVGIWDLLGVAWLQRRTTYASGKRSDTNIGSEE